MKHFIFVIIIFGFTGVSNLLAQRGHAASVLSSGIVNNQGANRFIDPQAALGDSDAVSTGNPSTSSGFVSLGGGFTIVDMGYKTPIADGPGNDLRVYEVGVAYGGGAVDEPYEVFVQDSRHESWISVGKGAGISEFDLSGSGLAQAQYVMIIDRPQIRDPGASPTADIDAIEALNIVTLINEPNGKRIPFSNNLEQNYPKPFNPETKIASQLLAQSNYATSVLFSGVVNSDGLNPFVDPQLALGPPDAVPDFSGYVSLGGGFIIVDIGYKSPVVDGSGADLKVYEIGDPEPYEVYVRSNTVHLRI